MAKKKVTNTYEEINISEWRKNAEKLKKLVKNKKDINTDQWISVVKWEAYTLESLSEDEWEKIRKATMNELEKTEEWMSDIIGSYNDVKKWYLDNETRSDPFYVDYNLLYNNVDMMMALSYSNDMKAVFTGTNSADVGNADIITKTAEYDWREEMNSDLVEYEVKIDKYLFGMWAVVWEWNYETNAPYPVVAPAENCRPDLLGRWHIDNYRYIGWYWMMTKAQMRAAWDFFNIDDVKDTERTDKDTSAQNDNWSRVTINADDFEEESAYFAVYNHFRTKDDGTKCLVTLANNWKLIVRYIELDYQIGKKNVFPISLDTWKPKRWYPMGIKMYDLSIRKQKVLGLVLNLAIKKSIRSSLWNHIIVDDSAVKNKNQLRQLTEFPEIILVDTNNWTKPVTNLVAELPRSQVPQDNYNIEERLKQINQEETSIWSNQLWVSAPGNQTATEIKDMAANSNVRLSLTNRIAMIYYKDFWKKWLMMYNYHFPEDAEKQISISREFGDRYLTFKHKYLDMSGDPHVKIVSQYDMDQLNKKLFANHIVLHSYIEKLAMSWRVPLEIRLSLRKALRLMGYPEDEILDYVKESAEEQEAKAQLYLLNRDIKLEPLDPDQIDEFHEDYLHVYRQAKETNATRAAVMDRLRMQKKRDKKNLEQQKTNNQAPNIPATGWMQNQMTANMIWQQNAGKNTSLADVKL